MPRSSPSPDIRIKEAYTPAVYNDPAFAAQASAVFKSVLGDKNVDTAGPAMTAEDFGRYGRLLKIPSLLLRLGATPEQQLRASKQPGAAPTPGLHTSHFVPDMPLTLQTGVRAAVSLITALMPRASANQ
jgi:hippurate hydrolase